jgi:hypothetical protein
MGLEKPWSTVSHPVAKASVRGNHPFSTSTVNAKPVVLSEGEVNAQRS